MVDENLKISKLLEFETKGGVYKMATQGNLLYIAICSTLYVYSVEINLKSKQYELRLLRKNMDFAIINDLYCHENFLLVSDVYKSITLFKFDEEKEKLTELCRDFNPIWCYALTQVESNLYTVSDIDGNLFSLRREMQPKSDEENYKLERVAQFNFGERINKMMTVSKSINAKDWENIFAPQDKALKVLSSWGESQEEKKNQINVTYFGTLEGTFGLIATLPKDTFEFLQTLQKEILKTLSSTGNFDYEKWRAFKVRRFFINIFLQIFFLLFLGWIYFRLF
jgi:hypothetical protein